MMIQATDSPMPFRLSWGVEMFSVLDYRIEEHHVLHGWQRQDQQRPADIRGVQFINKRSAFSIAR
jgi:hypothetical protein